MAGRYYALPYGLSILRKKPELANSCFVATNKHLVRASLQPKPNQHRPTYLWAAHFLYPCRVLSCLELPHPLLPAPTKLPAASRKKEARNKKKCLSPDEGNSNKKQNCSSALSAASTSQKGMCCLEICMNIIQQIHPEKFGLGLPSPHRQI